MGRVSVGGAASIQGTTPVPRPTAATTGALQHSEVKRAKMIALGLFVALVLVHAQREG